MVYCNTVLENALPVNISQLVSCLKDAGFEVGLFDTTFYRWSLSSAQENRIKALQIRPFPLDQFNEGDVFQDFIKKINDFKPHLIGFSVIEPTLIFSMKLLETAREIIKTNKIKVAVGGVHVIIAPHTIAKYDIVDYICISEGEMAFIELCRRLANGDDVDNSKGFWVRKGDSWLQNPKADLVDINLLPPLDFSLFSKKFLVKPMTGKMYNTITIETTRGCPYRCTYCAETVLKNIFKNQGRWYREKTLRKVFAELAEAIKIYNAEYLYIISDSFAAGKTERLKEFCERYNSCKLPFWFNTRPEDIDEEKAMLVKEAGCHRISIGLEHGNEKFRKVVLKRYGSNEKVARAGDILREYELLFSVNIILGFPGETREMVFDTIEMVRRLKSDSVSTCIFNPYHGTGLRDICIKKGYIQEDLIAEDIFQNDYLLKDNSLSKEEVLGLFRTIPLYVEFPKSAYKRIETAEKLDNEGNRVFEELKKEFYQLKGW
ncbi:MAG: B12-binding domain-containing radical SAM protein [Candidatus Omnitrophica bacterium]|nr:B12-binding domain-containing radical SAM protein [Candidatus Omnitrophota bacterium]